MKILIADDEDSLRSVMARGLACEGCNVSQAENGNTALSLLETEDFDVLVLDINMPDISGIDVLKMIREREIPVEVIMLTGGGSIISAVEAMKLGAYDYLTKPIRTAELKVVIEKAFEKKELLAENRALKTRLRAQNENDQIITKNPSMLDLMEQARIAASSDYPVLIFGESGVGKEVFARYIHESSSRAGKIFMPINCGAMPEQVIESELFGYEKGAFTGAAAKKPGLFEIADHGTIFLDEIGEMPLSFQVKLLRVLETKTFMPLGGARERRVDVRIISATNKNLTEEVVRKHFRQDLFYRINSITFTIPPLRERREDIPLLIDHFRNMNKSFSNKRFSEAAVRALCGYTWAGNVRELMNVVQKVLLFSKRDVIDIIDLPADVIGVDGTAQGRLEDIEKGHILRTLREVSGHRGKAAEILGIDPKTLYRKMKNFNISE